MVICKVEENFAQNENGNENHRLCGVGQVAHVYRFQDGGERSSWIVS